MMIQKPKTTADTAAMLEMLNRVYHRDPTCHQGMDREFPHLFAPQNHDHLYYVTLDQRVVSMVGVYPQTMLLAGHPLKVWSIGCVATDPLYEKRGIATEILRQVLEDGHDRDIPLALISGERGLYRRLNAVSVGIMIEANGEKTGWQSLGSHMAVSNLRVRQVADADRALLASPLVSLYQKHPSRFVRSADHMATLLNALWFQRPRYDQRLFAIEASGSLAGYAVAYRSLAQPNAVTIMEWGGSLLAILPSLTDILERFGGQTLTMNVPASLKWLNHTFRSHAIETRILPLQGTVRVLNGSALFSNLRPLIRENFGVDLHLNESRDGMWRGTGPDGSGLALTLSEIPPYLFNPYPGLSLPMAWTHDLNFI